MDTLTNLIELGAIVVFVYYALTNNREWRRYLKEKNDKLEKILEKLLEKVE